MSICSLLAGNLRDFHGLSAGRTVAIEPCLGKEFEHRWLAMPGRTAECRIFAPADGAPETWLLYDAAGAVELVEIFRPVADLDPARVLATLGRGEQAELPLAARLQRPIITDEETAVEHVYAARGLAALVASAKGGERVARLRAFVPTSLEDYLGRFVRLPSVRFEGP